MNHRRYKRKFQNGISKQINLSSTDSMKKKDKSLSNSKTQFFDYVNRKLDNKNAVSFDKIFKISFNHSHNTSKNDFLPPSSKRVQSPRRQPIKYNNYNQNYHQHAASNIEPFNGNMTQLQLNQTLGKRFGNFKGALRQKIENNALQKFRQTFNNSNTNESFSNNNQNNNYSKHNAFATDRLGFDNINKNYNKQKNYTNNQHNTIKNQVDSKKTKQLLQILELMNSKKKQTKRQSASNISSNIPYINFKNSESNILEDINKSIKNSNKFQLDLKNTINSHKSTINANNNDNKNGNTLINNNNSQKINLNYNIQSKLKLKQKQKQKGKEQFKYQQSSFSSVDQMKDRFKKANTDFKQSNKKQSAKTIDQIKQDINQKKIYNKNNHNAINNNQKETNKQKDLFFDHQPKKKLKQQKEVQELRQSQKIKPSKKQLTNDLIELLEKQRQSDTQILINNKLPQNIQNQNIDKEKLSKKQAKINAHKTELKKQQQSIKKQQKQQDNTKDNQKQKKQIKQTKQKIKSVQQSNNNNNKSKNRFKETDNILDLQIPQIKSAIKKQIKTQQSKQYIKLKNNIVSAKDTTNNLNNQKETSNKQQLKTNDGIKIKTDKSISIQQTIQKQKIKLKQQQTQSIQNIISLNSNQPSATKGRYQSQDVDDDDLQEIQFTQKPNKNNNKNDNNNTPANIKKPVDNQKNTSNKKQEQIPLNSNKNIKQKQQQPQIDQQTNDEIINSIFDLSNKIDVFGQYSKTSKSFYNGKGGNYFNIAAYYLAQQFYFYRSLMIDILSGKRQTDLFMIKKNKIKKIMDDQQITSLIQQLQGQHEKIQDMIRKQYQKCKSLLPKQQNQNGLVIKSDQNYHFNCLKYLKSQFNQIYPIYQKNKANKSVGRRSCYLIQLYCLLLELHGKPVKEFMQDSQINNIDKHIDQNKKFLGL